jgi:hypothetical protein
MPDSKHRVTADTPMECLLPVERALARLGEEGRTPARHRRGEGADQIGERLAREAAAVP